MEAIFFVPIVYFLLVRPLVWIAFKVIPDGRMKTMLFRERG